MSSEDTLKTEDILIVPKSSTSEPSPSEKGFNANEFRMNNTKYREKLLSEFENSLPRTFFSHFFYKEKGLFDYVDFYAKKKPNDVHIIEYDTGEEITWKKYATASKAFASRLSEYGIKKGDIIATSLPFLKEHLYLWMGAMRLGAILAPLDLRLRAIEVNRLFDKVKPKMYFFLGLTPIKDFREVVKEVMLKHDVKNGGSVKTWVQFQKKKEDGILDGAIYVKDFAKRIAFSFIWNKVKEAFSSGVYAYEQKVDRRDCCNLIFTTGSTGSPKAAMLSHEGVIAQAMSICHGFLYPGIIYKEKFKKVRILVNLPPSHVGGLTEQYCSVLMGGQVAVILHVFKPDKSLDAVQKYKVNTLGQIPSLFNLQWKLDNYKDYDLSSLSFALYGGQAVSKEFLIKLQEMGKMPGSGMGLTECSGITSYTPIGATVEDILKSLGFDSPLCPISIRKPMKEDGTAGEELKGGEVGEICYSGPQIFLGYYGDEKKTKESLSSDGILYSGDIGSYTKVEGLQFSSRRKFIIKPKGYQVYPHEVENFIKGEFKEQINNIAVVGVSHEVYSQGVVAVIQLNETQKLTQKEVIEACQKIASYKRPSVCVFVKEFPFNRVAKTDYLEVTKIAEENVEKERENGGWDQ